MNKHDILTSADRPPVPQVIAENIPQEMRNAERWIKWRWVRKDNHWTKGPVGKWAKPQYQKSFDEVYDSVFMKGRADGIGYVLRDGDFGIDLDDCIVDGQLNEFAQSITADFDCYYEISPSGTGIKLYSRGVKKVTACKGPGCEVYDNGRWFVVTSQGSGEFGDRQEQLDKFCAKYLKANHVSTPATGNVSADLLDTLLSIHPKDNESDGSCRMVAWCARCVGHDVSDEDAITVIREAENTHRFPKPFTDEDIIKRLRSAEERTIRGTERPIFCSDAKTVKNIEEAVARLPLTKTYQNVANMLCRFGTNADNEPSIQLIPQAALMEVLMRGAVYKYHSKKNGWYTKRPDDRLIAAIAKRGYYPAVPVMRGVLNAPVLHQDGTLVRTPGYDSVSQHYLHFDGEWPDLMSVEAAKAKLLYVLQDFPFDMECHRSVVLAGWLTLAGKNLIEGNSPFFITDGNRAGTGKSKLVECGVIIHTGFIPKAATYTTDSAEMRKLLLSAALEGKPYLSFDNVETAFGGAELEAMVTSSSVTDRVLGASRIASLPFRAAKFATMNTGKLKPDMVRRSLVAMLNTDLPNPEDRTDFKESNLIVYVTEHRRELHIALLSLLADHLKNGTAKSRTLGSFEKWCDLIGGTLVNAGLADPVESVDYTREETQSDLDGELQLLFEEWPFAKPVRTREASSQIMKNPTLSPKLFERLSREENITNTLGQLLRRCLGHQWNGKRFTKTKHDSPKWVLEAA